MHKIGDIGWSEEEIKIAEHLRTLLLALLFFNLWKWIDVVLIPFLHSLVDIMLWWAEYVEIENEGGDEGYLQYDSREIKGVLAWFHTNIE